MSEFGVVSEHLVRGNLGEFMVRAIEEGQSANATLAAWREAGGIIDRTFGLKLFGEMRDVVGQREALAGLDPAVAVPIGNTVEWRANGPGQFASWVTAHGRFQGERDVSEFRTTVYSDRLLSQQEAADLALEQLGDFTESGTFAGFEIFGAVVTSVSRLVGRSS